MIVGALIENLKWLPQDLEVYSYTDHGQMPEPSYRPQVVYIDSPRPDGYISKEEYESDPEYYEDYYPVVLL